ncbi:hypothetical protein HZA86_00060 [Candidatus Uhrbacteria bacterium]|nr:hypothetical protein [Candidatus Uhrbacteria bacterium]
MPHEFLSTPVDVLASFNGNGVKPVAFKWGGRRISVEAVNLVFDSISGRERIIHFAVSSAQAAYQLDYYSLKQQWKLSGYYVE